MGFNINKLGKKLLKSLRQDRPIRLALKGDITGAAREGLGIGTLGVSEDALQALRGPGLPDVPPPLVPPPPQVEARRPPARDIPEADLAESDVRALFRRRGRRTTLLTPGGGAGQRTGKLGVTGRGL